MKASNHQGGARRLYLVVMLIAIVVVSIQLAAFYNLERFFSPNSGTSRVSGDQGGSGSGSGSGNGSGNGSGTNSTRIRSTNYVEVDTFINYGNSTAKWFNDSTVPPGWNFYNLTIFLANGNVEATWYPIFQEHLINAINGVKSDTNFYWSLWTFCQKDQAWALSNVGADDITLSNDQRLAWYFISYTGSGPPVPGEKTVTLCST